MQKWAVRRVEMTSQFSDTVLCFLRFYKSYRELGPKVVVMEAFARSRTEKCQAGESQISPD